MHKILSPITDINQKDRSTMSILQKLARYRDLATNEVYDIIRFTNRDGVTGEIEIIGDQSAKLSSLETALLRAGAKFPQKKVDRDRLLKACVETTCPFYELRDRAGWTEDLKTFVLPLTSIGSRSNQIRGVSKNRLPSGICPLGVSGTMESWRTEVASIVASSSVGVTVLSAVFAAPLLNIVRHTSSFGLCVHGESRLGKTALLVAAASAMGLKSAEDLAKWCNTPTGFQQLLASANDGPLLVDDLENINGSEKDVDRVLRHLTRTIESGSGTNRDGKYARKTGAGHDRWRCIVMTSSENSLSSTALAAGRERKKGELIRLIDVPAVPSKKPFSLYERLGERRQAPISARLHESCHRNHGVAFRVYVETLIKLNRKTIEQRAFAAMKVFMKRANIDGASPAVRDIATKFSIIYAGGILATEFEVTGWKKKIVLSSLLRVFSRIKKTFPDEQAQFCSSVEALDKAINVLLRKRDIPTEAYRTADGYRSVTKNQRVGVMRSEIFNRILPDATIRLRIAKDLTKCGVLRTKKTGKSLNLSRPGQSQITWPDNERRRSYKFVIPRDSRLTSILGLTKKKGQ